jgi:Holliday junction resolvase RusA-like endonuclease
MESKTLHAKQVIKGVCPSKSNGYKIVSFNGRGSLAKSKALKDYEKSFYLQCNHYRNANISGLFEFYIDVYYPANRADLDGALKVVLDVLQKEVKAIKNDNTCIKIVAQKFVDKDDPRIEFLIKEV